MPRPIIPLDRAGYMIVGSTVHTRYATHVPRGLRVRTADEAFAAVARTEYTVCSECYPHKVTEKPRRQITPRRGSPVRSVAATRQRARLPSIDELVEGS